MNDPGTTADARYVRLAATAALLTVFAGLVAGCDDGISSTAGRSGGGCWAHTVSFQEETYHEYGPLTVEHGKRLGTGDELVTCSDARPGPTGSGDTATPTDKTTPVAIYAIDNLDPARAVAIETDADGVVMLVPAEGKPDSGLKKYAHN